MKNPNVQRIGYSTRSYRTYLTIRGLLKEWFQNDNRPGITAFRWDMGSDQLVEHTEAMQEDARTGWNDE